MPSGDGGGTLEYSTSFSLYVSTFASGNYSSSNWAKTDDLLVISTNGEDMDDEEDDDQHVLFIGTKTFSNNGGDPSSMPGYASGKGYINAYYRRVNGLRWSADSETLFFNYSGHNQSPRSGAYYNCMLSDDALVSGHRPSVDVLFGSVALAAGSNAIGVILTGMGKDGANGMMQMREAGAMTFGQDESSCLIYGMPKAAKEAGGVQSELPLTKLAAAILEAAGSANETSKKSDGKLKKSA